MLIPNESASRNPLERATMNTAQHRRERNVHRKVAGEVFMISNTTGAGRQIKRGGTGNTMLQNFGWAKVTLRAAEGGLNAAC